MTGRQRSRHPSMVDGLTVEQRKILCCAFEVATFRVKVKEFIPYVIYHYDAYHGDKQSLESAIISMACNFVGSNNINLLSPGCSSFSGIRIMDEKDEYQRSYTQVSTITRCIFHTEDDPLLNYVNENAEPKWYIPIIPMILINGSEGTETFVPNYNPRDVIANLQRLLNGESMVPMDPWYKWFKGTVEKTETGYTTTGTAIVEEKEDGNATLRITEFPVGGLGPQDYKEFLKAALLAGKDKEPFIKEYKAHHDDGDCIVDFEVVMTADQMEKAREEGLYKRFKLTTTLSTSNMRLLDAKGEEKKYDTAEQIIEDFVPLRLEYYKLRKEAQVDKLREKILKRENIHRYLKEVGEQKLDVVNMEKEEACAELSERGYTRLPSKTDANPGYDYLVSSNAFFKSLVNQRAKIDETKKKIDELTKTSPKSLWLRDLETLKEVYDREYEKDAKEDNRQEKLRQIRRDPLKYQEAVKAWCMIRNEGPRWSPSFDKNSQILKKIHENLFA